MGWLVHGAHDAPMRMDRLAVDDRAVVAGIGGTRRCGGLTALRFASERENGDEEICAIGTGPHEVGVDLMPPVDPERTPAVHATALNHVGLRVDDLPAAVAWLTAQGVRFAPGDIRKGAAGHDICFVHPKGNDELPLSGEGVLIELVQAPPEVFAALARGQPRTRALQSGGDRRFGEQGMPSWSSESRALGYDAHLQSGRDGAAGLSP